MLAFSMIIAWSFSLGSTIANKIDPVALNAVRFAMAAGLVGAIIAARGKFKRSDFRAPWRYVILGSLFALYFVLMFEGLKTASPVSTSAVFTLTPILSAGFGWMLMRQVTTPRMAVALLLGGAGALWVIFRADLGALLAFDVGRGEAIFFVGVVAHALYAPLARRMNRGESPLVFTFGIMAAMIVLLLGYGWKSVMTTDWAALSTHVWLVIVFLAVFPSALTSVLLQFSTLRLPSAKLMAYGYLVPSWVICIELLLGKGAPPPLTLAGIALTLLALALLLKNEG